MSTVWGFCLFPGSQCDTGADLIELPGRGRQGSTATKYSSSRKAWKEKEGDLVLGGSRG